MKNNLLALTFLLIFSTNYSQRNLQDSLNLAKVDEIHKTVESKLTGLVTNQDIDQLTNFLWSYSSEKLQFICLMNNDLTKLNKNPNQKIDEHYLNVAFSQLKNKQNVTVELTEILDYYDFYDENNKKSDYMLVYKIRFLNKTSFGENTENYLDLKIDVINEKIIAIFCQADKI
jgi:hypothetical protein